MIDYLYSHSIISAHIKSTESTQYVYIYTCVCGRARKSLCIYTYTCNIRKIHEWYSYGVRCRSDLRWNNWAGVLRASYDGKLGIKPVSNEQFTVVFTVVAILGVVVDEFDRRKISGLINITFIQIMPRSFELIQKRWKRNDSMWLSMCVRRCKIIYYFFFALNYIDNVPVY